MIILNEQKSHVDTFLLKVLYLINTEVNVMGKYEFKTSSVCAQFIRFDLDGEIIHNVQFIGGCNGNLQAISKLIEGQNAHDVIRLLEGNDCGGRGTSCADQLTIGLSRALEHEAKAQAEQTE